MGEKETQPEVEIRYALYHESTGRYYGYENDGIVFCTSGASENVATAFKWGDPQKATFYAFRFHPDHKVVAVESTHHPATTKPVLLTTRGAAVTGTGVLGFVVTQHNHAANPLPAGVRVFRNHAEAQVLADRVGGFVKYVRLDTIPGRTEYRAYHLGPDYDRPIPTKSEEE